LSLLWAELRQDGDRAWVPAANLRNAAALNDGVAFEHWPVIAVARHPIVAAFIALEIIVRIDVADMLESIVVLEAVTNANCQKQKLVCKNHEKTIEKFFLRDFFVFRFKYFKISGLQKVFIALVKLAPQ
jgi:hypothetical protein